MKQQNQTTLRRSLLAQSLIVAMSLPFSVVAFAQDANTDDGKKKEEASNKDAKEIESVVVVGSRIKRSQIEGASPVTIITRSDIDREGFQTVGDALQTLTQNTTSSFTGDLAVTGFSPNAQVVNLRNLGPGYTLTLVNGRRPAQYPQPYNRDNNVVNVRAIPTALVERIEVLSGGASAIYGSDAVAGVVNIVLRKNYDGNALRAAVGVSFDGAGDAVDLEFTTGKSEDRWSGLFAAQYHANNPIFANEIDFLSDTRNGPLGRGINPATNQLFTNPAFSLIAIRRNGAQVNQNAYYPGQAVCDRFGYTTVTTPVRGTYCGSFNQVASRSIQNENQSYSLYGSGTFDVNDNVQLFANATYYKSNASSSSGTEFWGTSGDRFNQLRNGAASTAYFDPQFGSLIQLQRVFNPFELGGATAATTKYDESTYDVLFGAQGTFAERFDWEASAGYSKYNYTADRPRLLAQGIHDYFLGPLLGFSTSTGAASTAATAFPVYRLNLARWTTPFTPEQYAAVSTRVINEGNTSSANFNFNVSGDLFDLPAGAVGFAGVLEAGRQTVDLRSDPRTNQIRPLDSQTIYNLTSSGATQGTRDRYAAGFELRAPLFSQLTANLAGRYDKYDDITAVDDAITYQLGLEWRPVDSLLLRTSYGTSFRAPDMQLVFAQGAASFSGVTDEYACRSGIGLGLTTGPRTNAQCAAVVNDPTRYTTQTVIAGNPLLKEEEGKSLTVGFVWDITENMALTTDYYRIRLSDAASQLSSSYILQNEANCRLGTNADGTPFPFALSSTFCQNIIGLVTRQVAPGTALDGQISRLNSAYINTALTDTSGIDANFKYNWDTDSWGKFGFELGYSLLLTNKNKEFSSDPLIDYRDDVTFDFSQRSRMRGTIGWQYHDWSTTLFGVRYGTNGNAVQQDFTNAAGGFSPRRLPAYVTYNLTVGKKVTDNLSLQLQIVNLLDDRYRKDNSATGYPFYNPFIGADPVGRRWNFSVSYKF
jgi:iron complex outermembrane recepter protein